MSGTILKVGDKVLIPATIKQLRGGGMRDEGEPQPCVVSIDLGRGEGDVFDLSVPAEILVRSAGQIAYHLSPLPEKL